MPSTVVTLKALPVVPGELTLSRCVSVLYAFNDYAKELAKLFPRAVDDMSPDYDRLALLVSVGKEGVKHEMKHGDVASYDDFCLGMSAALEFKDAFDAFEGAVRAAASSGHHQSRFQQVFDFYVTDFRRDLESSVCRLWSYHPLNVDTVGKALRRWNVPRQKKN